MDRGNNDGHDTTTMLSEEGEASLLGETTSEAIRIISETGINNNNDSNNNNNATGDVGCCCSYVRSNDFLELLIFIAFGLIIVVLPMVVLHPRQRPIPFQLLESDDGNNNNEYVLNLNYNEEFHDNNETVSDVLLVVLSFLIPLIVQALISKFVVQRRQRRQHQQCHGHHNNNSNNNNDTHATICVYVVAMSITTFVTECIKNYVGYLRPIFYDICQPNDNYSKCTNIDEEDDARKSFISGHASMSFCGMTLISLYLLQNFGIHSSYNQNMMEREEEREVNSNSINNNNNKPKKIMMIGQRIVSILCVSPILLAFFIATSRIVDNKHFPADVIGGSVLGYGIAYFIHGLWFLSS